MAEVAPGTTVQIIQPGLVAPLGVVKGDTGPANSLAIGTVVDGGAAAATITGTAPSQTLNLTLPQGPTGPTGATGPAGITWTGAWSAATTYAVNEGVTYGGQSFRRKVAGTTATSPDVDGTNWELLAAKGAGDVVGPASAVSNRLATFDGTTGKLIKDSGTVVADLVLASEKGAVSGVATLDGSGKVPAGQLPSYVDDVVEYANLAAFPGTGVAGLIYVAGDNNKTFRWSGSAYVEISPSEVNSVAGKTGVVTLVKADIADLGTIGTAAAKNTGTASGDVPLLSTGGVLPIARIATGTPDGTKFVRDDGTLAVPAGGGATDVEPYVFRKSGTLAVASGAERIYLEGNYTLQTVRAAVGTAPVGASLICDVNKNGTTIYTTQANRPTIATVGAVYIRPHTSGTTNASGTTVAATIATADVAVGNTLVLWWASDNVTDSTNPVVSSISTPAGETNSWVKIAQHDSSNASSASGVRGEMWVIETTVTWPVSTAVTVTSSVATSDKLVQLKEFSRVTTTVRGASGTGTSSSGIPTASTSGTALVSGDLVLGSASFEYGSSATIAADSDSTNGSWVGSVIDYTSTGTSVDISAISQHKIVTATGVQTYNPNGSGDSGAAVVALVPTPGPITATANNPDITTFAAGDYLTVDVDQVGSTTAGSDLTVTVRLQKT